MSKQTLYAHGKYGGLWIGATLLGMIVGVFAAIILSELILNIFYPEETNLIVGLCIGATIALLQKIAAKDWIKLSLEWVWGAMLGIGIPFAALVIVDQFGIDLSDRLGMGNWIPFFVMGACAGLLQVPALRPHTSRPYWWILISAISWGLTGPLQNYTGMMGYLSAGLVLAVVSYGGLLLLSKKPITPMTS